MPFELLSWSNIKDRVYEWQPTLSHFNLDIKSNLQPADRPIGLFIGDEMLFEIGTVLYELDQIAIALASL